ncbi:protein HEADING DATE 3B-like isoform X1 [Typha angustifolia]|uniref:protein HEADING DATE 3B-like isoform X1 n=2 Tax=Typha angustifolia TaxID=59011 RepID=UPI003C2C0908
MQGVKEEDTMIGPLFPRLHVNDADKGGPRPPPRNKMALYEQFSIPSQRLNSKASSMLPLPLPNASNSVPSTSSGQGCGHERTALSPFFVTHHTSIHASEKNNSCSSDGVNLSASRMEFERRPIKYISDRRTIAGSVSDCSSRPPQVSNLKNSSVKKFGDEDDFRVPTFAQPRDSSQSNKDLPVVGQEKLTSVSTKSSQKGCSTIVKSSIQCSDSNENLLVGINPSVVKSRNSHTKDGEKEPAESSGIKEAIEKSVLNTEPGEKLQKQSGLHKVSLDREYASTRDASEISGDGALGLYQEYRANGGLSEPNNSNDIIAGTDCSAARMRNESCLKASIKRSDKTLFFADSCCRGGDDKEIRRHDLGDEEQKDESSDSLMVDSVTGSEISPDDIVGVIGPKQFWKARRAIVNQQRVFALQVFELHRLIKVQKLIAASPDLLLEGNPYLKESSTLAKNPPPECNLESQPQIQQEDDAQKPKQKTEWPKDHTEGSRPLPSCEDGLKQSRHNNVRTNGSYSGNPPPPVPMASENTQGSWCLQPAANQWLMPVLSPSEGLVYKPYTGSCPPNGSFLSPFYGGCISLPPAAGDFTNSAYSVSSQPQNMGVLPSTPGMAPNYFPPYGIPSNPVISASAVEEMCWLGGSRPSGQAKQHSWSSCNMSRPKKDAFSGHPQRSQALRESEIQGSTASSPSEKPQVEGRDSLSLFPVAPATDGSTHPLDSDRDNQTRVIKVVPHNARSATESAARIFRSIQRERQQHDL